MEILGSLKECLQKVVLGGGSALRSQAGPSRAFGLLAAGSCLPLSRPGEMQYETLVSFCVEPTQGRLNIEKQQTGCPVVLPGAQLRSQAKGKYISMRRISKVLVCFFVGCFFSPLFLSKTLGWGREDGSLDI